MLQVKQVGGSVTIYLDISRLHESIFAYVAIRIPRWHAATRVRQPRMSLSLDSPFSFEYSICRAS